VEAVRPDFLAKLFVFFLFLLLYGCTVTTQPEELVPIAKAKCIQYGQGFLTLGFNGSEFRAYCVQENPCKLLVKGLPGGKLE